MDFSYQNVTYDIKQLVEVLHCDLQVMIHEGLMETQTELLETIGGFVNHFQMEMATLSPPQMHTLLNHLCTRWDGGQALLNAIHWGEMSTIPESFLQNGPSQLLLDFYLALPDHQINIQWESMALSHFEIEVNNAAAILRTWMVNMCLNPALMLNFKPSIQGVATINLTQGQEAVEMPPFRGNITPTQKHNADLFNIIPDNTSSIREEPWTHTAHFAPTSSGLVAPQPSTSVLPSFSSDVEKSSFTPSCLE